MAKPGKTDLANAYVALSMNGWAKATVELERQRERERRRLLRASMHALERAITRAG